MGVIREQEKWVEHLYRIQVSDPILGGSDGIINVQPSQLANRTAFLKALALVQHCEYGHHAVTNEMVAEAAAIVAEKLKLDVSLEEIDAALTSAEADAEAARNDLSGSIGVDGLLIQGLAKIIQLTWRYSDFGFEFEFFTDGLTMRDLKNIDARGAIALDDSLDCENTSGIVPGMRLLVSDGIQSEEVEIWKILEKGRIRLVSDLKNTYPDAVTLGYTDWTLSSGHAVAEKDRVYYSKVTSVLESSPIGRLIIRRDSEPGKLAVCYRDAVADSQWTQVEPVEITYAGDGLFDEHYTIEGGSIQLRLVGADTPVKVYSMALFPIPAKQIVSSIRTPFITIPAGGAEVFRDMVEFTASVFRSAYKDDYAETEYAIIDLASELPIAQFTTASQGTFGPIADQDLPPDGHYAVKCRHKSDIGEWSAWSSPVKFTIKEVQILFGFIGTLRSSGFGANNFNSLDRETVHFGFAGVSDAAGFTEAMFTTTLED